MATPMRQVPSQQGKTPSQSQHGAAATPSASTPFSAAASVPHAAFSPLGPRSSPQQVKKSPATSTTLMGHPSIGGVNFDSPSAAGAFGALGIGNALDLGLDGVGVGALALDGLTKVNEDQRARKLEEVIDELGRTKGIVSDASLERLVRRIGGLECLWENDAEAEKPRTLIVAGSSIELLIVTLNNAVQSVTLGFPTSAENVTKHAERAGQILLDDLRLDPGQIILTKRMDRFAANFERLAILDKLSIVPGLNLFEAVAGIYESLENLHRWDLDQVRNDPATKDRSEEYQEMAVMCRRHGRPVMHGRDHVGLSIDYWRAKHQYIPTDAKTAKWARDNDKYWSLLVSCAPSGTLGIPPVRVSDKWISDEIEKAAMTGELQPEPVLDWLQPDNTILPETDATKAALEGDDLQPEASILGPRLPNAMFVAYLDRPIHLPFGVWDQVHQLGGAMQTTEYPVATLDALIFPIPSGLHHDPSEPRTIKFAKKLLCEDDVEKTHENTLYIYKPVYGKTLTEVAFSHPQQVAMMLPFLRQYAFLSTILDNSFVDSPIVQQPAHEKQGNESALITIATTTGRDEFADFMEAKKALRNGKTSKAAESTAPGLRVDVTLTAHPMPRLQIVFPFRDRTANVMLDIRPNAEVAVVSQNVLDETNSIAPNGRERKVEDLAGLFQIVEDIGKWCEFLRSNWA